MLHFYTAKRVAMHRDCATVHRYKMFLSLFLKPNAGMLENEPLLLTAWVNSSSSLGDIQKAPFICLFWMFQRCARQSVLAQDTSGLDKARTPARQCN